MKVTTPREDAALSPGDSATQHGTRVDKWLWAVRVFKTRSLATDACKGGLVESNGNKLKPSHEVKLQEIISARVGDILRTVKVTAFLDKRVGAPVAKSYCDDLTPPEEYEKRKAPDLKPLMTRPKGSGRPTKKDRRSLERLSEEWSAEP